MTYEIDLKLLTDETLTEEDRDNSGLGNSYFELKSVLHKKGYGYFKLTRLNDFYRFKVDGKNFDFPLSWIDKTQTLQFFSNDYDPNKLLSVLGTIFKGQVSYLVYLDMGKDTYFVMVENKKQTLDEIKNIFYQCLPVRSVENNKAA